MIQEGIFNALKDDSELSVRLAKTGGGFNIYPFAVPEDTIKSYSDFITYAKISSRIDRQIGYYIETFQINAISKKYSNVQTLAQRIIDILSFYQGNLGGKIEIERTREIGNFEIKDEAMGVYIIPIDFKFVYKNYN